jgi:hypothetical protein
MAGRKIDDHSFWAGSKSKSSVFPDGPHKEKHEESAESAGAVTKYEDTTEMIKEQQVMGMRKSKAHPLKTTYRN